MADLVIGIDIGTGSTKGVLSDTKGNVLYSEVVRHETSFPKPGWAEHDADAVWWSDVVKICRELATRAKGDVAGLCISGIGPVFLAADAVSYTHLTLPTIAAECRSRWSPYH